MAWLQRQDIKNGVIVGSHIDASTAWDFTTVGIKADVIAESTSAAGVTVDGVLLKDSGVTAAGASAFTSTVTVTDGVASGDARRVGGRVDVDVANGTAHTNSTDETVLTSYSIPANTIKAGTVVKVRFCARVSAEASTTTLTCRLRLGATTLTGTALITSAAVDADVDYLFTGEFTLVGRATPSASAAVVGVGSFSQPAAVGGALVSANLGATNFATSGALLLELTADWSAADANSIRSELWVVEVIG